MICLTTFEHKSYVAIKANDFSEYLKSHHLGLYVEFQDGDFVIKSMDYSESNLDFVYRLSTL